MGAIHELRAEYRHYRVDNPQYRLLFIVVDILALLIKLALFAGVLVASLMLANRGSLPVGVTPVDSKTVPQATVPALTGDRIALLKQIAGQPVTPPSDDNEPSVSALVRVSVPVPPTESEIVYRGAYLVSEEASSSPVVGSIVIDQPPGTVVQVAAATASFSEPQAPISVAPQGQGDTRGSEWAQQQPSGNFTVQIAMTSNRPFLDSFANKLPAEYISAIYPERRTANGEVQYSLSLGNFPSRSSAESLLSSLPQSDRRYGAHLRRFDDIQRNLSSFGASTVQ